MKFNKLNSFFSYINNNLKGQKLNSKIVVIESDDWGAIRMPNKKVFEILSNLGIPVQNSVYCKFDTLESNDDVSCLLETLSSVKTREGQSPKLTANFVVSNPDFKKMQEFELSKYFFEPISETYNRLTGHDKVLSIINQGMSENLVLPQFHGRDHINVPLWLELIKTNKDFKLAFDLGLWGLSKDVYPKMEKSIQATYDSLDIDYCNTSIQEGLTLFEIIFGFKSKSFIANNYIWPTEIENILFNGGVMHIQGMNYHLLPLNNNKNYHNKERIYLGYRNNLGMTYGVRNCSFEPIACNDNSDKTLFQIKNAFLLKKPAIINTHRINFSGGMNKVIRDKNLNEFKNLIKNIVLKWPDVKFMTSAELGNYLNESRNTQ